MRLNSSRVITPLWLVALAIILSGCAENTDVDAAQPVMTGSEFAIYLGSIGIDFERQSDTSIIINQDLTLQNVNLEVYAGLSVFGNFTLVDSDLIIDRVVIGNAEIRKAARLENSRLEVKGLDAHQLYLENSHLVEAERLYAPFHHASPMSIGSRTVLINSTLSSDGTVVVGAIEGSGVLRAPEVFALAGDAEYPEILFDSDQVFLFGRRTGDELYRNIPPIQATGGVCVSSTTQYLIVDSHVGGTRPPKWEGFIQITDDISLEFERGCPDYLIQIPKRDGQFMAGSIMFSEETMSCHETDIEYWNLGIGKMVPVTTGILDVPDVRFTAITATQRIPYFEYVKPGVWWYQFNIPLLTQICQEGELTDVIGYAYALTYDDETTCGFVPSDATEINAVYTPTIDGESPCHDLVGEL